MPRLFAGGLVRGASGPAVAFAFHRALGLISVVAWLSLAWQVKVLIGPRGLLPVKDLLASLRAETDLAAIAYPSLLRFDGLISDGGLVAFCLVGALLSLLALANLKPRLCFTASTILYLSCVSAARTFTSFQWDNLLLEMGFLAALLPAGRAAPIAHLLLRLLLFKLYFESGIAKWQSPLRDWQDGSAMTFYYETAPLPAWPAFYAHHLPAAWHAFEGWATLVVELVVPFFAFGPRVLRRVAFVLLTGFQVVNFATANYGFFVWLALALHVFLLDEADVERGRDAVHRLGARWRRKSAAAVAPVSPSPAPDAARPSPEPRFTRTKYAAWSAVLTVFVALSLADGVESFSDVDLGFTHGVRALLQPFRLVNTYHLFASITRERIEPEVQVAARADGPFVPLEFHHKPGDPHRRPDFVAPHQPRVDFQLWFYGLGFRRSEPAYVGNLIRRLCTDPDAVQSLFATPLPARAAAVRLVFYQYKFASLAEKRAEGIWWRRSEVETTRVVSCDEFR